MLEFIALSTMIADHVGKVFFPDMLILQIIGRLSFVIYAYFIAIGYRNTKNAKKYFVRILIVALISQFFYSQLIGKYLNICFTLSAGIVFLMVYNNKKIYPWTRFFLFAIILFVSLFLGFEYGAYGIITIFLFYILEKKKDWIMLFFQVVNTILCILIFSYHQIQYYSLLAFPIIIFLKKSSIPMKILWHKRINYVVYPFHLVAIYVLRNLYA